MQIANITINNYQGIRRFDANPAAVLELIRQREELLAALKESQSVSVNFWVSHQRDVVEKCMCAGCIEDRVQEAIAKAEG